MVKTEHFCCAGKYHRELSELSQDYYAEGTKNDIIAISLCDGASFSRFSGLAAQVVSELCVKILLENFERYLTENPFRVRYEIAKKIDIALTRIGKKKQHSAPPVGYNHSCRGREPNKWKISSPQSWRWHDFSALSRKQQYL